MAAAGVLPFFNSDFRWEEIGLGLMSSGIGIAILATVALLLRREADRVRGRPGLALLTMLGAAHSTVVPILGAGLLLFGAFLLLDAIARG